MKNGYISVLVLYFMSFIWLGFGLLKILEETSFFVVGFAIMTLVFLRLWFDLISSIHIQQNKKQKNKKELSCLKTSCLSYLRFIKKLRPEPVNSPSTKRLSSL